MHNSYANPEFMYWNCGHPGQSLHTSVVVVVARIHKHTRQLKMAVHKLSDKPVFIPLPHSFLCTVYEQFYNTFISVNGALVHSMHRAYIYEYNSKKGIN